MDLLFGSSSSPTLLISKVLKKGTRNGKPNMGSQNWFQQFFSSAGYPLAIGAMGQRSNAMGSRLRASHFRL